ncbi:hypothetical protein R1sor_010644 [Riccia sorocarpa]|uniref:Uncharacterized protein n=1 Tax=Riccia sorocarpa TaxID=122646 RepID=A0ABD3HYM8_9MARC
MVVLFGEGSPPISNIGKMRGSANRAMYRLVSSVASEAMGLGKSTEVLTVLGGKASCRRKFVLNLHLVDEYGCLVSRDLAIVASVAYAHDHSPVVRDEKPFLAEPPLFTTFNGVEFPAQDRPTRMVSGRASFKLAISLLSSKCDNRLFCICFTPQPAPGETSPICAPCYSKPIRSISRKRTQSAPQVSSSQPLLLLAGLHEAAPRSSTGFNFNTSKAAAAAGGSAESDSPKYPSPGTSNEKDGDGPGSPIARLHLQGCSQSSSVTSMHHYLSPRSAGLGIDDSYATGNRRSGGGALLVLHESPSGHGVAESLGNLSAGRGERSEDTDNNPSGSSSGNMASISRSPGSSSPVLNGYEPPSAVPCSLSLRLSPSDSDSPTSRALTPTSGALTSGRSFYNNISDRTAEGICTNSSSLAAFGNSRPFSAPSLPTSTNGVRPFRPYGSISSCKASVPDFKLGAAGFSLASMPQSEDTSVAPSTHSLLERVQQLRAVSPGNSGSKVDQILHNFAISTRSSEEKFSSALTEISLDEEEKSLQYIEVSLQEVSRDIQRRKEELRSKRRRLLEDEARMHSIVFSKFYSYRSVAVTLDVIILIV